MLYFKNSSFKLYRELLIVSLLGYKVHTSTYFKVSSILLICK